MKTIDTITSTTVDLTKCHAMVEGDDDLPAFCGEPIVLKLTTDVVGDDYGSWPTYRVYLACGHSLSDMESGLRHAEYL